MNILDPISTLMTTELITLQSTDKLSEAKRIFDENKIHHIPIVRFKTIIGLVSKTDLLSFLKGITENSYDKTINGIRLKNYPVEQIMTKGLATLSPSDKIGTALEVFKANLFHSIPIVENEELVGILTTYDIINALTVRTLQE